MLLLLNAVRQGMVNYRIISGSAIDRLLNLTDSIDTVNTANQFLCRFLQDASFVKAPSRGYASFSPYGTDGRNWTVTRFCYFNCANNCQQIWHYHVRTAIAYWYRSRQENVSLLMSSDEVDWPVRRRQCSDQGTNQGRGRSQNRMCHGTATLSSIHRKPRKLKMKFKS